MSTTWVFIGLLAGRELAIALGKHGKAKNRNAWMAKALSLARKDVYKALFNPFSKYLVTRGREIK